MTTNTQGIDLRGHFSIAYSPDDEAETGKGYYADLWWAKSGPLYKTSWAAGKWAVKHGGIWQHPSGGQSGPGQRVDDVYK